MKHQFKRAMSLLLALVMVLSVFAGTALMASAKTGTLTTNTGKRHQVCTSLSSQARAYYTGNYTYEIMSELTPGTENCLDQSSEMFNALSTLMSDTMTHSVSYKSLTKYWPKTDASAGSSNAVLFYSDEVSSSYNREHVWPKSRASFYQSGGGCDLHHLRPTNADVNSTRSHYTMGNVRGVLSSYSTKSYNGKDVLYYSTSGNGLVEVNDNIKGDVARIFLYVWCRWQEPNLFLNTPNPVIGSGDDKNDGLKVIESLETLLQWCEEDPVDDWEMGRNDQVENVQGNRNVFIDYPEFAWLIFGLDVPEDMQTPSGEAKNQTSYTVTARANNDVYGAVSVDGKVVTAVPKTGYSVAGYTLEPADAATVTRNGNIFTLSKLQADCTITINFEARTPATVTYSVPSGVTCAADNVYVGDSIELPTPSGNPAGIPDTVEKISFFGWSRTAVKETSGKPSALAAGSTLNVTGDVTFHGVYCYRYTGDSTWMYASDLSFCTHENTRTEHKDPTCAETGYDRVICEDCGAVVSETVLAKTSHHYEDTVVAPTCTESGYTLHKCSGCGDEYRNKFTEATGHAYENGICTNCGEADPDWEAPAPFENPFSDVADNAWYCSYVMNMAEAGVINGYEDGTFRPENNLTRAEMVTLLYKASGSPVVEGTTTFTDVSTNAWYMAAVTWAEQKGIVNGVGDNQFEPEENVSREQLVTMLWRLAGKPTEETELTGFEDMENVNDWAAEAFRWAVANGIINGTTFTDMSGTYLAPQDRVTRAEAAKILWVYTTL